MFGEIARLMVLIFVFAATLLAVEGVVGLVSSSRRQRKGLNHRLEMIAQGVDRAEIHARLRREVRSPLLHGTPFAGLVRGLDRLIVESGTAQSSQRVFTYMLVALLVIAAAVVAFTVRREIPLTAGSAVMIVIFAGSISFGLPFLVLSRRRAKRRKKLVEQFPLALDIFVRGLRAGHPVGAALTLTKDMSDPIGSEFGLVIDEITYGLDLRDALQNMADRCGIEDMHMFVVSLSIQKETGGNLSEILEKLSQVIRDRASLMLKVRALSSEGRMSGTMLTALPVLSFSVLFLINPGFYLDVATDPIFIPGFAALLILYAIGFIVIRRMVDLKV